MNKNATRRKPSKIYRSPCTKYSHEDAPLTYWVQCPKCGGRAMDISDLPEHLITLGCKCPCCQSFVDLHLVSLTDSAKSALSS